MLTDVSVILVIPSCQLGAVLQLELAEDGADMSLYSALRDPQSRGNLSVSHSRRDAAHDRPFAVREGFDLPCLNALQRDVLAPGSDTLQSRHSNRDEPV